MNLIETLARRLASIYTQSDPLWLFDSSLVTVSSVVGRDFKLYSKYGQVNLNLFVNYTGASGIAMKSLPIKQGVTQILRKIQANIEEEQMPINGEEEEEEGIGRMLVLPKRMTEEVMLEMKEMNGLQFIDEFTGFLSQVAKKGYMAGILPVLSDIWDGDTQDRLTKTGGLKFIDNPFLNILSTCAYDFLKYIDNTWFTQGIGARFLYVYEGNKAIRDYSILNPIDAFDTRPLAEVRDMVTLINSLRRWEGDHNIIMTDEAKGLWTNFEYSYKQESINLVRQDMFDKHYAYLQRLPLQCLKIAGILAVGDVDTLGGTMVELNKRHMERAIDVIEKHKVQFFSMSEALNLALPDATPDARSAADWDRYLNILEANNGEMYSKDLRKELKWNGTKYAECTKAMIQANVIEVINDPDDNRKQMVKIVSITD